MVVALPLFARTAPDLELSYTAEALAEGRAHRDCVSTESFMSDLDRVIRWLKQADPAVGGSIGCLGFCFGGLLAWWAATHPSLRATVSAYGARALEARPGGGERTVDALPQIDGHFFCVLGGSDPLIPTREQQALAELLHRDAGSGWRRDLKVYPAAGHGFLCEQRADFQPEAAAMAWADIASFFKATLAPASWFE